MRHRRGASILIGAESWNRMIGPDADVRVNSLTSERRLYAGTFGRGVLVLATR